MPTASRLVAALILAALGWFCADLVKAYVTEGLPVGKLSPVAAVVGLGTGWLFTGRKLERKQGTAVAIGLTSSVILTVVTAAVFGGNAMLERALRKSYDGPMEAILGFFAETVNNLVLAAQADVIIALVVGGVLAGWLTGAVSRRFS
ncbi:MAG: TrgA family protein [Maritimibacter sp.]